MEAVNQGSLAGARDYAQIARRNYAENVVPMQEAANTLKEHLKARLTQASAGKNVRYATPQLTIGILMNNPGFIDEQVDLDKLYESFASKVALVSKTLMDTPEFQSAANGQYMNVLSQQGLLDKGQLVQILAGDDKWIESLPENSDARNAALSLRKLMQDQKDTIHFSNYDTANQEDIGRTLNSAWVAGLKNSAYSTTQDRSYVNYSDPAVGLQSEQLFNQALADNPELATNYVETRATGRDSTNNISTQQNPYYTFSKPVLHNGVAISVPSHITIDDNFIQGTGKDFQAQLQSATQQLKNNMDRGEGIYNVLTLGSDGSETQLRSGVRNLIKSAQELAISTNKRHSDGYEFVGFQVKRHNNGYNASDYEIVPVFASKTKLQQYQ